MSALDKATEKARAREQANGNHGETTLTTTEEIALQIAMDSGMIGESNAKEMIARLKAGELETAPQLGDVDEGATLHGILEGYGPVTKFTRVDKRTQEVTHDFVDTWIFASAKGHGTRISILSDAQLDRKLPPYIGAEVWVTKLGKIKTNAGFECNNWAVAGTKLPDGKRRVWNASESPATIAQREYEASLRAQP